MNEGTRHDRMSALEESRAYRKLVKSRKRFIVPSVIILLGMLLLLATLSTFTSVLDAQIVPGLNGAILFAYVVFFAPVLFSTLYMRRAEHFDRLGDEALHEVDESRGGGR